MNVQKPIVIILAVLINAIALTTFNAATPVNGAAAAARPGAAGIQTLPVIEVRPSAGQLRVLRRERAAATLTSISAEVGVACVAAPHATVAGC